jgi:hypothetical protein
MQVTEAHSLIQGPRRLGDRRHDKDDKAGPFQYRDRLGHRFLQLHYGCSKFCRNRRNFKRYRLALPSAEA